MSKLLRSSAHRVGEARANGRLYLIAHYPGFVPSEEKSDWVRGEVYNLHDAERTYAQLDTYENCATNDQLPHEFQRVIIPVLLDSGECVDASVYLYAGETAGRPRIASGDFAVR